MVVDAKGKKVDEFKLGADRFGLRPDAGLLHLAVRVEQAARRRGTASTKSRGEVSGSTAKLYRQKGTGRARAGSAKSPTRVGGGVAFGPQPRSFEIKINRKAARKALAMALSDRAESGSIYVTRGLELDDAEYARRQRPARRPRRPGPGARRHRRRAAGREVGAQPLVRRARRSRGGSRSNRSCALAHWSSPRRRSTSSRGVSLMIEAEKIIIRPIISEKSYAQIDHNRYTFEVHPKAHKTMIAQAVEQLFDVKVVGGLDGARPPQAQAPRVGRRSHRRLEEGRRPAGAVRQDRILRGQVSPWASRRFKPTSPGRRFMTTETFEEITRDTSRALAASSRSRSNGRPQQQRPHHDASQGWRTQAPLPCHRLQARQGRRAGEGRADRVRPQPVGAHRAAALRRRREALHPSLRTDLAVGDTVESGPGADIKPGNALPLENIPTGTTVHNVELYPGRGGQLVRSAGTSAQLQAKEKGYGVVAHAVGELRRIRLACRATVGDVGNADHSNIHRRQGRPEPLARRAPDRARHGDEPGRPSARRRRGQDHRRPASGHALGRPDARLPHALQAQAVRQVHHPRPQARQALGTRQEETS